MNISNARLSHVNRNGSSDLTVSFRITWNEEELGLRSRYICKVVLKGRDLGSDETLTTIYLDNIECNGMTNPVDITDSFTVSNRILNEDGSRSGRGLRDEVYAKIYVYAGGSGVGTTNEIRDRF